MPSVNGPCDVWVHVTPLPSQIGAPRFATERRCGGAMTGVDTRRFELTSVPRGTPRGRCLLLAGREKRKFKIGKIACHTSLLEEQ